MKIHVHGENLMTILHTPHISEKATNVMQDNQYVFRVAKNIAKKQIRLAVEKYYNVKVQGVNVVSVRGKVKGMGRSIGRRKNWKKAYVTLQEGNTITMTGSN